MKKVLSIVAVAAMMLFAGKASAQLSIHAGYQNYTLSTQTEVMGTTISASASDGGFYVGANYGIAAGMDGVTLQPGAYFAYVENIMDLRVPILLNYSYQVSEIGLGIFVGPQVTVGLAGDAYGDNGALKRFDVALSFGAQATYQKFTFELGYNLGLLNRLKDADGDNSIKSHQFFLGVGYML